MGPESGSKARPKIGITGLTTCAGDQLSIVNCEDQLVQIFSDFDIELFLMASSLNDHEEMKDFDVGIVEGCVGNDEHLHMLKSMREHSKILVAFGTCATDGGIPLGRQRLGHDKAYKTVFGNEKQDVVPYEKVEPIDKFVNVDFYIRGCPVRQEEIVYYLGRFLTMPPRKNLVPRFDYRTRGRDIDRRCIIRYNPNKCILCKRCDAICRDALGVDALGMVYKGGEGVISTPFDVGFDENGCIHCGQCASMCSVGALYFGSVVPDLLADMEKGGREFHIVVDSMVFSSLRERWDPLADVPPAEVEMLVVDSLHRAGFKKVLMYDPYLEESIKREEKATVGDKPRLVPWCKGAMNYVDLHAKGMVDYDESISPWSLVLSEYKDRKDVALCIASPCTAHKTVGGFAHVLSIINLVRLFRKLGINIEFSDPAKGKYDGRTVPRAALNKKVSRVGKAETPVAGAKTMPINSSVRKALAGLPKGTRVDMYPCLGYCLSGGGNYPTTTEEVVVARQKWLNTLWGGEKR